jgi:hypothetical protein
MLIFSADFFPTTSPGSFGLRGAVGFRATRARTIPATIDGFSR